MIFIFAFNYYLLEIQNEYLQLKNNKIPTKITT